MDRYDKEYLRGKMEDFKAFRDGMKKAGFADYVSNRQIAIILYSMWKR